MNMVIMLVLIIASTASSEIIRSAKQISGPGIITKGCIYGKNQSVSDHAPIVFDDYKIATWNITARISHIMHARGGRYFLNHKFKTNERNVVINGAGRPAIKGFLSEAKASCDKSVNRAYEFRIGQITENIKVLFKDNDLLFATLQEIPPSDEMVSLNQTMREMIRERLSPELVIHYPQRKIDKQTNIALITNAALAVTKRRGNANLRAQPFCIDSHKFCIIAVHLPFATGKRIAEHCQSLQTMIEGLYSDGTRDILVSGDFNTTAEDIEKYCKDVPHFAPTIFTHNQKPLSCKDNEGKSSDRRIDLLMLFQFSDEV